MTLFPFSSNAEEALSLFPAGSNVDLPGLLADPETQACGGGRKAAARMTSKRRAATKQPPCSSLASSSLASSAHNTTHPLSQDFLARMQACDAGDSSAAPTLCADAGAALAGAAPPAAPAADEGARALKVPRVASLDFIRCVSCGGREKCSWGGGGSRQRPTLAVYLPAPPNRATTRCSNRRRRRTHPHTWRPLLTRPILAHPHSYCPPAGPS